jgi:hypothetical protein
MVTQRELVESPDITPSDFLFLSRMKSEVYKRNVDKQE